MVVPGPAQLGQHLRQRLARGPDVAAVRLGVDQQHRQRAPQRGAGGRHGHLDVAPGRVGVAERQLGRGPQPGHRRAPVGGQRRRRRCVSSASSTPGGLAPRVGRQRLARWPAARGPRAGRPAARPSPTARPAGRRPRASGRTGPGARPRTAGPSSSPAVGEPSGRRREQPAGPVEVGAGDRDARHQLALGRGRTGRGQLVVQPAEALDRRRQVLGPALAAQHGAAGRRAAPAAASRSTARCRSRRAERHARPGAGPRAARRAARSPASRSAHTGWTAYQPCVVARRPAGTGAIRPSMSTPGPPSTASSRAWSAPPRAATTATAWRALGRQRGAAPPRSGSRRRVSPAAGGAQLDQGRPAAEVVDAVDRDGSQARRRRPGRRRRRPGRPRPAARPGPGRPAGPAGTGGSTRPLSTRWPLAGRASTSAASRRGRPSPSPTSWTSSTTRHTWRGDRRHIASTRAAARAATSALAVVGGRSATRADVGPEGGGEPGGQAPRVVVARAAPQPAVVATRGEGVLVDRLGEQRRLAEPGAGDDDRDRALPASLDASEQVAAPDERTARPRRSVAVGPRHAAILRPRGSRDGQSSRRPTRGRTVPLRANAPLAPCWCPDARARRATPRRCGAAVGPQEAGCQPVAVAVVGGRSWGPAAHLSRFPAVGSGVRLPRRTPARHVRPVDRR